MKESSSEILKQLTLEEKCKLSAQEAGSFGRVRRLGLEGNVPQDNPRNGEDYTRAGAPKEGDGKYHPVAFPSAAAMGASWSEDLACETGKNMALLCRANPDMVSWLFRPGVNLKRSALCGRNFEYFSEDPVAAGELAGSYIQGLQSGHVAATLKHFICNNQEFERMTTNSVVSERALREVYLKTFEIAIQKGKPLSVMSSYNKVNGEWVNSNVHIMELLRKELGYDGVVVSDFAAIHHNKVRGHSCGMDIELAPVECHWEELFDAVKKGEIAEEKLDEELGRVFDLCDLLYQTKPAVVDMEAMHEKARMAAAECMVLLKNNGILPLKQGEKKILVAGALAGNPSYMGGGSGHMNGYRVDLPLEKIREYDPGAAYAEGYRLVTGFPPVDQVEDELIREAAEKAAEHDLVIFFAGPGYCTESEGYDRDGIELPESQKKLLQTLLMTGRPVVLVLSCASVIDLSDFNDRLSAILYAPLCGEAFGSACADILFGVKEAGGRLSETWPVCLEHTPAYLNFAADCTDHADVVYGEDLYVGYRWYQARKLPVLYPFGYGLSYTSFETGDLKINRDILTPDDEVIISCRVKNTGERAGSQVLQLYILPPKSAGPRPVRELRAFGKVYLAPGEEKTVSFTLGRDAFQYFSAGRDRWIVESGEYRFEISSDLNTPLLTGSLLMTKGDRPFLYNEMTAMVWFCKNPGFKKILKESYPQEVNNFFDQEKNDFCVLCYPVPFYRLAEPLLGKALFQKEEIRDIIDRLNRC